MFEINCIVIGASAGGLKAMVKLFNQVNPGFPFPIVIVQHVSEENQFKLPGLLADRTGKVVEEAIDKMQLKNNCIYFAPPGYHSQIIEYARLGLNIDPPVNFSRPSIDELFISAAEIYKDKLMAILLSGADQDGSIGIQEIHKNGGVTIAQSPEEATASTMPKAAIETDCIDHILKIQQIAEKINEATTYQIASLV